MNWPHITPAHTPYTGSASLATVMVLPCPGASVVSMVTGQLCALREHITMKRFKAFSHRHFKTDEKTPTHKVKVQSLPKRSLETKAGSDDVPRKNGLLHTSSTGDAKISGDGSAAEDANAARDVCIGATVDSDTVSLLPGSARDPLDAKYLSMAEECTKKLVTMCKEDSKDGWLEVGTTKNVYVTKKLPLTDEEPPINSIRGTGTINTPPEFLLRLLMNPDYFTTLDEMLKEGRIVHTVSPAVEVVHLIYKAVWPTSPRDFSLLSITGRYNSTTWISSAMSLSDERIPPMKGYVRAEILSGGYVIEAIANSPNTSFVTYAACVDLKGNIPAFAVNKIAESQPMCISRLQKIAEPLYAELTANPQKRTVWEERFPISPVIPEDEGAVKVNGDSSSGVAVVVPSESSSKRATGMPHESTSTEAEVVLEASKDIANRELQLDQTQQRGVASGTCNPLSQRLANSDWHFEPSAHSTSSIVQRSKEGFSTPLQGSEDEQEESDHSRDTTAGSGSLVKDTSVPVGSRSQSLSSEGQSTPSLAQKLPKYDVQLQGATSTTSLVHTWACAIARS